MTDRCQGMFYDVFEHRPGSVLKCGVACYAIEDEY